MKKLFAFVLAVMMLLGCLTTTAFADETSTLHYYFDPSAVDYYVNEARAEYDDHFKDLDEYMFQDMLPMYQDQHPGYVDDNGAFLTDAVKEILTEGFSKGESVWSYDWLCHYYFTENNERPGWWDAEVPTGLNLLRSTLRPSNGYMLDFSQFGSNLPDSCNAEMWAVLTMNAGKDNIACEFYAEPPAFWHPAPISKSGETTLTATKAEPVPVSYEIVIPTNVAEITDSGVYAVGQPKVTNVQNATADTVISYTATTGDFKLTTDETKTMAATYHTEEAATNPFPTTAVTVYQNKAAIEGLPTMYVKIAENVWKAAKAGTYTATVTFDFEAVEAV